MYAPIAIFLTILFLYGCLAKVCKPDYYWRPFKGEIPPDAFVAGEDTKGNPTYVAKIVPPDQYLWTTPAQLFEGERIIHFSWYGTNSIMRVEQFIHILCINEKHSLEWVEIDKYPDEITKDCCLVEGGVGKYPDNSYIYISYIARKVANGITYIGRSYNRREWHGIHMMVGLNSTKLLNNFELLAYDCDKNKILYINYRINSK